MIEVRLKPGEAADRLVKRFSRAVRDAGVLREHVRGLSFEKPSKRRRKHLQSVGRIR